MDDRATVEQALAIVNDRLPSLANAAPVDTIQYEIAVDSTGQEATFITVVLEDNPSGDLYPRPRLQPIYDLIWEVFTHHAIPQKPYVDFFLASEMGGSRERPAPRGRAVIDPCAFLDVAKALATLDRTRPLQASLRRAVSTRRFTRLRCHDLIAIADQLFDDWQAAAGDPWRKVFGLLLLTGDGVAVTR